MKRYSLLMVLALLGTFLNINGHGFGKLTIVDVSRDGQWPLFFIHNSHEDGEEVFVKSYDLSSEVYVNSCVEEVLSSTIKFHFKLGFDWDTISCSPLQEFYLPKEKQWVPAHKLKAGNLLLGKDNKLVPLRSVQFINEQLEIYLIKVAKTQCFFVGKQGVLTHNMALEATLRISVAIGEGAAAGAAAGSFWGPVTIGGGVVLGGILGAGFQHVFNQRAKDGEKDYIDRSIREYISSANAENLLRDDEPGLAYRDPRDKKKPKKNDDEKQRPSFATGSPDPDDPNNPFNRNRNRNSRNDNYEPQKERKFNTISRSDFAKIISDRYEKYGKKAWRLKSGAEPIEKAEYLTWDKLHGEVEAFSKTEDHLGAIDPQTLKIYKSAKPSRKL